MDSVIEIFEPIGDLDVVRARQLNQAISQSLEKGANIVLIDLENVTFIDSSGLGTLILILKKVRATGGKLFLCTLNETVKMFFQLTSVDCVFETFARREDVNQLLGI
jgi:anti-anti-sigma factor